MSGMKVLKVAKVAQLIFLASFFGSLVFFLALLMRVKTFGPQWYESNSYLYNSQIHILFSMPRFTFASEKANKIIPCKLAATILRTNPGPAFPPFPHSIFSPPIAVYCLILDNGGRTCNRGFRRISATFDLSLKVQRETTEENKA